MKDENIEQQILDYIAPDGVLIPSRCIESIIAKRGWRGYVLQRYTDNTTTLFKEPIRRIYEHIETTPVCKACGKPVVFKQDGYYPTFCCAKCKNNDPEVKAKNKAAVSKSLKAAYADRKEEINSKREQTLKNRFGEGNSASPFGYKKIRETSAQTLIEKYGVDNVMKLDSFHNFAKPTARNLSVELWKSRGLDIEYTDNDTIIIKNGCSIHGDIELDTKTFNNRTKAERINVSEICPECNALHMYSGEESVLAKFLDANNIEHEDNTRKIIKPLELDFYIPSHKLAIEMNGIRFHSEYSDKDTSYHLHKTEECAKQGIQLIHIWESHWITKNDIVLSMLRNRLGITPNKIYARECEIREVTPIENDEFLNANHLQGAISASVKLGLYYKGELVSLMTFGKLRRALGAKKDDTTCELYRFCNKLNTNVVGGASKLFSHALQYLKELGYNSIITYAKRDWSNGSLYETLGFKFEGYTVPGYFWTNRNGIVKSRWSCRKSAIAITEEEKKMTETEIMHSRGFMKCYDSGNIKYSYQI